MINDITCNLASLDPYIPTASNPWNVQKIHHLYRRIAFGASKSEVTAALSQNDPSALVDQLIDDAISLLPTTAPAWGYWVNEDFENAPEKTGFYRKEGKKTMVREILQNKVRERMTLFWSNHFVTEDDVIGSPAYQYQYYNLLQYHAVRNFRDFVYDIGISAPMLVYLNGDENTKGRPNENYARELYELFTLGVDNGYTEDDIIQTAKALTGWVEKNDVGGGPITFNAAKFSNDTKTIFGQTGNWGYDDVITILFTQRTELIAKFICGKLYRYFVSPTSSEVIVDAMAQTLIASNFDIAPVLRELFKSEHFFNEEAIGVIIKSPCDLHPSFYNEVSFTLTTQTDLEDYYVNTFKVLGQDVLNPYDVAGWQGDEDWISPDLLIGRWESIRYVSNRAWNHDQNQFSDFLIGLPIGALADGTLTASTDDVELVVRTITNYFFSRGITDPVIFIEALGIFKGDSVPENYYEDGTWTLSYPDVANQFYTLLDYISEIPEFQLK
ncbi:DUF1800 domain-containing protein [Aquimarina intermedia]|uniref:Uncharacterized protein (DUF1800 family) n=1 Tax=Aquimarina intermedia TaxID=350814 RepID=A0A5S5CA12_9FLAO|nr:DUF1800 domain-containing protein [Aquimarina intermedia]TYP76184.1 uncharacterized protein (DUF1800 family) [Aquimarina intermedia]